MKTSTLTAIVLPALVTSVLLLTACGRGPDGGDHQRLIQNALDEFVAAGEGELWITGPDADHRVQITGGGGQPLVIDLPGDHIGQHRHHYVVEGLGGARADHVELAGGTRGYKAEFPPDDTERVAGVATFVFRTVYGLDREAQLIIERQ